MAESEKEETANAGAAPERGRRRVKLVLLAALVAALAAVGGVALLVNIMER